MTSWFQWKMLLKKGDKLRKWEDIKSLLIIFRMWTLSILPLILTICQMSYLHVCFRTSFVLIIFVRFFHLKLIFHLTKPVGRIYFDKKKCYLCCNQKKVRDIELMTLLYQRTKAECNHKNNMMFCILLYMFSYSCSCFR